MDSRENEQILSFDMLYTTNHIQIMKLLLPCFDPSVQRRLAVMIKYLEFQYTMDYFRKNPSLPAACEGDLSAQATGGAWDIVEIFSRIRSFCTPSERAMFDQIASLKKNMDMYEEMMNMMQMFQEFSGAAGDASSGNFPGALFSAAMPEAAKDTVNPMDLLKNMLSPEQQAMFDMFQSAFPGDAASQT